MKLLSTSRIARISLAGTLALGLATLSGCGIGTMAAPADTMVSALSGKVMGGPNPVGGSTITLYATTSTGYGVGQVLSTQTADANGQFAFTGVTCPAGEYAYITSAGGNTGSGTNANALEVAALGPCANVNDNTRVIINELTTAVAAYTLAQFMTVTGTTPATYNVGIGAPASNHAAAGCVANSYYGTATCPTTVSAGLKHAFANASMLMDVSDSYIPATTGSGAQVPVAFLFAGGNILQACINTTGETGTSSTSSTGDGSACGKLFAYTSYSTTVGATTTNFFPNNTLSAMLNLAKRPLGNTTTNWDAATCGTATASTVSGSQTSVQCLFTLQSSLSYYEPAITAAPSDWMLGISYPKGSFGGTVAGTNCNGTTFTSNALFYPFWVATDMDDNLTVLNSDSSNSYCYNLLTLTNSGTPIGSSNVTNDALGTTALGLKQVLTDAFGHAIVPAGNANTIDVYAAGAGDTNITQVASVNAAIAGSVPTYGAVENNGDVYITGQGGASNFQMLTNSNTSHTTPGYTAATIGTAITSKLFQVTADINGALWTTSSSGSTVAAYTYVPGASGSPFKTIGTGCSSAGSGSSPDNAGNFYVVLNDLSSCSNTGPSLGPTDVKKYTYTQPLISTAVGAETLVAQIANPNASQTPVVIDGNNVLWTSYTTGSVGPPLLASFLRGYETTTGYAETALNGCKLTSGATTCGSTTSNTPFLFYGTRGLAIDAAGTMWVANGSQGSLSEVFGVAAPTLPQFLHNGSSNKP